MIGTEEITRYIDDDKIKINPSHNYTAPSSIPLTENVDMTDTKSLAINYNNNYRFKSTQENMSSVFPKKTAVDLNFEDITFYSTSWSITKFKKETKKILHGVSGQFKSGELSVIMGPSGAGKSTLLNVLAGYITKGSTGTVKLNDVVRDQSPRYRKLSAYIPQDEELRMALTAKEAMTFAAHLKLGYRVSNDYKFKQIAGILKMLGLEECQHTLTAQLSGGQRKRLAVALELLSNPPILFLDEPTTGLDSLSCTQCVSLFKNLASEGRTVIATVHQPSALIFEMFDKLYALSEGKCIYDGRVSDVVPYFEKLNLKCPPYHNPADYLIEVSIGDHNANINKLADSVKSYQYKSMESGENDDLKGRDLFEEKKVGLYSDETKAVPAAIIMQFLLLYKRNLLIIKRCYGPSLNRVLAHIVIGLIFGYLYRNVGSAADTVLANYVYLYGTLLLTVYTGKMPVTLSFPLEMKILSREHFNRWYKLTPYLLSVILVEIPFQVICTWMYIAVSYWLTNQPLDFRLFLFVIFVTACSLCGQSMGYFIGATTPVKVAVFIAPVLACFLSVFGFCIRAIDTSTMFKPIFFISYFRAAFQSVVYSIYGFNREILVCPIEEEYCHYKDPHKFLSEMDILDVDLVSNFILIVIVWCVMHAVTYLTLWLRLNKR
ncbi:ATP binding cassette (ABC) transporter subfamily G member [Diabrotica virgifera virgifera]|uniref:ATP-binding cassette sub-family G member 1 n=1 Tax=Diabrotica virgifera virgifera TaxID=50390 RepID=A0A6P7FJB7_DIAVI|nr:ATP binding cassette (ABC) transporter subfamily G member [Diabrotica virgifera virgifera]